MPKHNQPRSTTRPAPAPSGSRSTRAAGQPARGFVPDELQEPLNFTIDTSVPRAGSSGLHDTPSSSSSSSNPTPWIHTPAPNPYMSSPDPDSPPPTTGKVKGKGKKKAVPALPLGAEKPPRPPNPWIIWRNAYNAHVKKYNLAPGKTQAEISKMASAIWKTMEPEEKAKYSRMADQAASDHANKYPNYRFQPRSKAEKDAEKAELKRRQKEEREAAKAEKSKRAFTFAAPELPAPGPAAGTSTVAGPSTVAVPSVVPPVYYPPPSEDVDPMAYSPPMDRWVESPPAQTASTLASAAPSPVDSYAPSSEYPPSEPVHGLGLQISQPQPKRESSAETSSSQPPPSWTNDDLRTGPGELNFELAGFNVLGSDAQHLHSMDTLFDAPPDFPIAFGGPPPSLDLAVTVPFDASAMPTSYNDTTMAALAGLNFGALDDQPPILPQGAPGLEDTGNWYFAAFGFPPPPANNSGEGSGYQQQQGNATAGDDVFAQNDGMQGSINWAALTAAAQVGNNNAAAAAQPAQEANFDFSEYLNYPPGQVEVEPAARNRLSSIATITPGFNGEQRAFSGNGEQQQQPRAFSGGSAKDAAIDAWRARTAAEAGPPSRASSVAPSVASSHHSNASTHFSSVSHSGAGQHTGANGPNYHAGDDSARFASFHSVSDGALGASNVANGAVPQHAHAHTQEQPVSFEQFFKNDAHHATDQPVAAYRPSPGASGAGKRRVGGAYRINGVLSRYPS